MKQAIAGVSPPGVEEVTVMTVWPTIALHPVGRWIGRNCLNRSGYGTFFTVGKLFALASIPIALALFFASLLPPFPFTWFYNRRYRLTNRRVIEQADRIAWQASLFPLRFLRGLEVNSVGLDEFDSIEVQVLPGQEWYPAGELIFRKGQVEAFRLSGVSRPETFRRTCLKAHQSYMGVRQAMAEHAT